MDAQAKFELLRWFFEKESSRKLSRDGYVKRTGRGYFSPSDVAIINAAFKEITSLGLIDTSKWLADCGSGDSRVTAVTNSVFGIPSISIEYDRQIAALGSANIQGLRELGILDGVPLRAAQGDFLEDRTYGKAWLRFEDVGTIFNYWNNDKELAAKISRQSKPGAVFIVEHIQYPNIEYEGLTLVKNLDVRVEGSFQRFFGVYRK